MTISAAGRASVAAVLDFAWSAGAFTATDAMTSTALTRSTVIEAIDTLAGIGILRELPNARSAGEYRGGRPARRFEIADDLGVVIGIDSGLSHLAVTVADPFETVLAHRRIEVPRTASAGARRRTLGGLLDAALGEAGVERDSVLALCAGVAAPVNRDGISPPHPDGFWERTNPDLADLLGDWAPVVDVKNDASLAAAAEGAGGAAIGCQDYVALLAGERFGAGVVVDGHLLHGAHGGVGEGVVFDHVVGVGTAYGLRYAIEREVRAAVAAGDFAGSGAVGVLADGKDIDPRTVLELAAGGDADAAVIADRVGETVAIIIGVLGSTFDPLRVIVCGAVADSIEPVLAAARRSLPSQLHLPAPELIASALGADVVSLGAVATARDAARTRAVPAIAQRRLQA
ncbi:MULTISPECIES: ROK family protein [unclassified Microbacterium]|uniref:ROK family protein n=1 Tax=unclassified Microbacterium TaxID=2609290 RepID=UPI0012FA31AB|nr:ROK family protein [Microbacterium sp. MAH-37]MVQ43934.1 ROK family protein [Microbacterium sp. MAH-37]